MSCDEGDRGHLVERKEMRLRSGVEVCVGEERLATCALVFAGLSFYSSLSLSSLTTLISLQLQIIPFTALSLT